MLMEHLIKFNEGFWGISKKDMFSTKDYSGFPKKTGEDIKYFHAINVIDISLIDSTVYSTGHIFGNNGVFYKNSSNTWKKVVFGKPDGEVWYDSSSIFRKLRETSKKLGYALNKEATILSKNVDRKIVSILDFCYYEYEERISLREYPVPKWTLLYVLDDDNCYNINQIEIVKEGNSNNLIDIVIKENFLDLIDEDLIEYVSREDKSRGKTFYNCEIKIKGHLSTNNLFTVSEQLLVASQRLKDQGYDLSITQVQTENGFTSIKFNCSSCKK